MTLIHTRSLVLGLAAVLGCASATPAALTVNRFVNFGDSLSDAGNVRAATGVFPGQGGYPTGTFSNGPVWVQQFGAALGKPVSASRNGGLDFASGGVTSGLGATNFLFPNVRQQAVDWSAAQTTSPTDLFTVLGGGNDLFNILVGNGGSAVTAAQNIGAAVSTLAGDGARQIMVANLPDLGLVPRYNGGGQQAQATALTNQFNQTLSQSLDLVQAAYPDLTLFRLDLDALFDAAIADKDAFQLSNVTDAAYVNDPQYLGTGTVVGDPATYLFYDDVHPTAVGHQLIANAAVLVPEPTGVAFAALAGVALLGRRRVARQS